MREAYLTGGSSKPAPKPATLAEALAAIENSQLLQTQAQAIYKDADALEAQAREVRKPANELWRQSDKFPYQIMAALGYSAGQVRRHVESGDEYVVIRIEDASAYMQKVTSRRKVGRELGKYARPLKYREYEDTGRRVKPLWGDYASNPFAGASVPKGEDNPVPFPTLPA